MEKQTLIYEVDPRGIIVSIEGPWDEFAVSNSGKALGVSETIGRNLFGFVKGLEVVHVYQAMHQVLRSNPEKTIAFAYRCDAPELRRFMKMEMRALGERIVYRSTVEKEEPVCPPITLDYERPGEDFIVMCAFCKDFRYPPESGQWMPIERVLECAPPVFAISHSICSSCFKMRYGDEEDDRTDGAS